LETNEPEWNFKMKKKKMQSFFAVRENCGTQESYETRRSEKRQLSGGPALEELIKESSEKGCFRKITVVGRKGMEKKKEANRKFSKSNVASDESLLREGTTETIGEGKTEKEKTRERSFTPQKCV